MIVGEDVILIKPLYLILMKNKLGNVKECKTLIRHGHVYVNKKLCTNVNYCAQLDDCIVVNGNKINAQPYVYYMMNKPKGVVSANRDDTYRCVIDLIDEDDCYCVGRLDLNTTGLLLLTNDSSLSKKLLLPQNHCAKKYLVTTKYEIYKEYEELFNKGVIIDQNTVCQSAKLEIIDQYHCYVTLHEGKYHQVKKMFLSCQNEVVELKRVMFAWIDLDENLKEGEYRPLNNSEINKLFL